MSSKKTKMDMPAELPAEVQALARKTVDQAQAVFDRASEFAHGNVQMFDATASACKNRLAELQLKTLEVTQDNFNAGFDFIRKLFAASEPSEVLSLHRDFAKGRIEAFQRHSAELNAFSLQVAKETMKPVHDSVIRAFAGTTRASAA